MVPWDIEEALKTVHRANIEALLAFHNIAERNPREVVLKMRTVLETHCLYLYPMLFDGGDTLGAIVGKIGNAGGGRRMLHVDADETYRRVLIEPSEKDRQHQPIAHGLFYCSSIGQAPWSGTMPRLGWKSIWPSSPSPSC